MLALIYFAHRISRPIQESDHRAFREVAAGHLDHRVPSARDDEIGAAIQAFNHMADELKQSQERLVYMTRLESWQALARKMAHEVKNSLTPIRLTMEEIAARQSGPGGEFYQQAAQIVVDEVVSLERRVRAFSEFSSEPPISPRPIDVNSLLEERIAFLKAAHPDVRLQHAPGAGSSQVSRRRGSGERRAHQSAGKRRPGRRARRRGAGRDRRVERQSRHRSARLRPRRQPAGAQHAVRAHHFVQARRHGPGTCRSPARARCCSAATSCWSTASWEERRSVSCFRRLAASENARQTNPDPR